MNGWVSISKSSTESTEVVVFLFFFIKSNPGDIKNSKKCVTYYLKDFLNSRELYGLVLMAAADTAGGETVDSALWSSRSSAVRADIRE